MPSMSEPFPPGSASTSDYQYNYTYVPPLAMSATVPRGERPSFEWYACVVWQVLRIARNRITWAEKQGASSTREVGSDGLASSKSSPGLTVEHPTYGTLDLSDPALEQAAPGELTAGEAKDQALEGMKAAGPPRPALLAQAKRIAEDLAARGSGDPLEALTDFLKSLITGPKGRPASITDYQALFATLTLPWVAHSFEDDATFAWLRVAGFNPLVIRQVKELDLSFPVTQAHFAAAVSDPGDSLALARDEGRLYLADYTKLAGMVNGNFPDGPKYVYAPKALFVLPRGTGLRRLVPVAIQCGQDPKAYPIFTPADGEAWKQAKVVVDGADGNYHELISHLGHTHLLIEPIVVATHRRLANEHPISKLLRPHFEGTISINNAAQRTLITAGHQVDEVMGGTIEASRKLAVESLYRVPYFNEGALPVELEARGVLSPDLDYPYRDDALLVWGAIERWVTDYLKLFYANDAAVAADEALRRWAAEIVAEDGGRLSGFGEDGHGKLTTLAYLIRAITMIMFTASAQHAAVNFAQGQIMTFTPAVPGGLYRAAPVSVAATANNPYLDLFPPLDMAAVQLEFLTLLGSVYYTRLGDYGMLWSFEPRVLLAKERFQKELAAIGKTIAERNAKRFAPYPFLAPDQIPQSINI